MHQPAIQSRPTHYVEAFIIIRDSSLAYLSYSRYEIHLLKDYSNMGYFVAQLLRNTVEQNKSENNLSRFFGGVFTTTRASCNRIFWKKKNKKKSSYQFVVNHPLYLVEYRTIVPKNCQNNEKIQIRLQQKQNTT